MGYRGMGSRGIWDNRVQGMGYRTHGNRYIECRLHGAIGYRGYGVKGHGHMGQ